jgi:hypothetical protein
MNEPSIHDFGVVDDKGDFYEFSWSEEAIGECRLDAVIQTERGPRRTGLALLPANVWIQVSERTIRELAVGMGETERTKKSPTLKIGINRLSPLIGRELAVLLWALMEITDNGNIESILHGWRELAREERWWLYAKGIAPGQRTGAGWRLALFHALSESPDSRSSEPVTQEKKTPGSGSQSSRKVSPKKLPKSKKNSWSKPEQTKPSTGDLPTPTSMTTFSSLKHPKSTPAADLKKNVEKNQPEKKAKKTARKVMITN